MGTTIHAHIEVKRNGTWMHFAAPDIRPDYVLFAFINGERIDCLRESLRQDIEPQYTKGLPEDISEITAHCYKQDTEDFLLRGEGVLTKKDLEELQERLCRFAGYHDTKWSNDLEKDIFHTHIGGQAIAMHRGWDDARVVFWYSGDN